MIRNQMLAHQLNLQNEDKRKMEMYAFTPEGLGNWRI